MLRPLGAASTVVLAGLLVVPACQRSATRTAPFRERPDTVTAGDLRGPFDGQVVEAAGGKPVAGAVVYATWSLEAGYGMNQPAGHEEFVTNTDAAGKYAIPAIGEVAREARITSFQLVVYKRGYVAYRSDRRFSDLGPRRDFAQHRNRIALERWREEFSHARHLRYVGGGSALSALTSWEAEEAAVELTAGRGQPGVRRTDIVPTGSGVYLVAAQLLTGDDIKDVTGFDGEFETGPLSDEPDTATYSSQHLKALGRPEGYDVALRLWRLEPDEAQKQYGSLSESLPGVQQVDEIADRSLRATEGNIFGIALLDGRRNLVVLLTCGQSQCASPDVAAQLGKHVFSRIEELWPLGVKR